MVTYKDIVEANKSIITTDIKGKDYAEVNQRIKAFRMVYPTGYIRTRVRSIEDGICIMTAEVGYYEFYENGDIEELTLATGTAYEKENSTFINKTSYIENCETSAIGRALGMAGFGIDTSVASAEEVQNAMANQEEKPAAKTNNKKPTTKKPKEQNPKTTSDSKGTVSKGQIAAVNRLYGLDAIYAKRLEEWKKKNGVESSKDMSAAQADQLIAYMKEG